jgi:hypothetical protein
LNNLEDDAVMIPRDEEEALVIRCFTLSIKGGMSGIEVDYPIIRDFSKKYSLDSIELLQIIKSMAGEYSKNG